MSLYTYQKVADEDDETTSKQASPQSPCFSTDVKRKNQSSRWLMPILLSFNISSLILAIVFGTKLWQAHHNPPYCKAYPAPGSRIDQWQPKLQEVLFLPDDRYVHPKMWTDPKEASQMLDNWGQIIGHAGMVNISRSQRSGLDPPYQISDPGDPEGEFYMLSGYRQLYCLREILESYSSLRNGRDSDDVERDEIVSGCFDYVRQGILCGGDVTLEGDTSRRYPGLNEFHSWGSRHVCRDWNEVAEWAEERKWELDFEWK